MANSRFTWVKEGFGVRGYASTGGEPVLVLQMTPRKAPMNAVPKFNKKRSIVAASWIADAVPRSCHKARFVKKG